MKHLMVISSILIMVVLFQGCKRHDESNLIESKLKQEEKQSDSNTNANILTKKQTEGLSDHELQQIAEKVLGESFRAFLLGQTYMTVEEAEKRWGKQPFSAELFRKGNVLERARMAVDLVQKGTYLGQHRDIVRKDLGRHEGFFWRDKIPAYLIEDDLNGGKESWQLVFLPDGEGIVRNILFNKQL